MSHQIFVVHEHVDFRKGAASLAGYCQQILLSDPENGGLFIFRNRQTTAFKMIFHDGQGTWLLQKRLLKGRFEFWPTNVEVFSRFQAKQLLNLLFNGNPESSRKALGWIRLIE